MTFIRFAIMLHQHGILHDLNFLMDGDHGDGHDDRSDDHCDSDVDFGDGIHTVYQQHHANYAMGEELEDQFSDPWSEEEEHEQIDEDHNNAKGRTTGNGRDGTELQFEHELHTQFENGVELRMHSDTEDSDSEQAHSIHVDEYLRGADHSNYSHHIPSGDSRGSTHSINVESIGKQLSMVTLNSLVKEHNSNHQLLTDQQPSIESLPSTKCSNPDSNAGSIPGSNPRSNSRSDMHHFSALTPTRSTTSEIMGSRYLREFDEFERCGFGTYGTVYRVRHKLDSAEYAIKKILYKHDGVNHDNIKEKLLREVTTIAQFNHVNVVRYYTAWIEAMPGTIGLNQVTPRQRAQSPSEFGGMSPLGGTRGTRFPQRLQSLDSLGRQCHSQNSHDEILDFWQKKVHYSCLFLQTEYCGNYALSHFIREPHRVPQRDDNMHLFSQILLGLAHIHSKGLLHRDLKPENIFLESNNVNGDHGDVQQLTVKIGDFGLSKSMSDSIIQSDTVSAVQSEDLNDLKDLKDLKNLDESTSNLTANLGTEVYAAPEQLSSALNASYDFSADIYSVGIILFELIQPPFTTMTERRMAISKYREHHEIDEERIDTVLFQREIKMMNAMTQQDASKRPSANELIHWPFIAEFWIKNVLNGAVPPLPVGTKSVLTQIERKHRSIEYDNSMIDDLEIGGDREGDVNSVDEQQRPALHHGDSIRVSFVHSPVDSVKSGGSASAGTAECDVKRKNSLSSSPVYLVTSPCGSPQEVTVPVPWVPPQMSPFCMEENENIMSSDTFLQTEAKEHHH